MVAQRTELDVTPELRWQDHISRDDLIQRLRLLAAEGVSLKKAAEVIGFGLTRHKVNGIARRSQPPIAFGEKRTAARRTKADTPSVSTARTRADEGRARRKVALSVEPPKVTRIGFVILDEVQDFAEPASVHFDQLRSAGGLQSGVPPRISDDRCRFPLWPDRIGTQYRPQNFELLFCGKPVLPGKSWCADCYPKLFTTPEPKPRPKRDRNGRKAGWEYGF